MTVRKRDGQTVFWLYTKYPLENNVIDCITELCKMVDKRDEIIGNANAEILKRGNTISELNQGLELKRIQMRELQDECNHYQGKSNRNESNIINSKSQFANVIIAKDDENIRLLIENKGLTEELKCIKVAKDKTDAENTRLWALDKNEMHRKYEKLHAHHLYEVGSLNDTIDDMCKSMRELKTSCAEKDRHIKMLGSVEFEAVDDGVHITYTVG